MAQREAVLRQLLLEHRPGRAGLDARRSRNWVDFDDAVQTTQIERQRRALGPDHHDLVASTSGLAALLADDDRLDESEALHRDAIDLAEGAPGDMLAQCLGRYGEMLTRAERWDEAEALQKTAELSHPRVVVETTGLSPEATELANRLAAEIGFLSDEVVARWLAELRDGSSDPTAGPTADPTE